MNGRIESDFQTFKIVEAKLDDMPQYVTDWYYHLKANENSAKTCKDFVNKVGRFLLYINPDIKKVKLKDIDEDIVTRYFIDIQTKTCCHNGIESTEYTSFSYRQSVWSCLNNFFKYLTSKKKIPYNYLNNIDKPKGNDLPRINRTRKLLTEEDFNAMLESVKRGVGTDKAKSYQRRYKTRDICIMTLFMTTGMRESALTEINIDDIDFENKKLNIMDKGFVSHEYVLSDSTIRTISDWLDDRIFLVGGKKIQPLFISNNGTRITANGLYKLIKKYSKDALGYEVSPHKLRSGLASIIYSKTKDIEFTRRVIGHSDLSTTQRYIVTDNNEREIASNIMENLLVL